MTDQTWTPDHTWDRIEHLTSLPEEVRECYSDTLFRQGHPGPIFYHASGKEGRIVVRCKVKDPSHHAAGQELSHHWTWDTNTHRWLQVG